MAFRFQRRIRIAPGVRINLSKSGVGLSVGPRGYSTSIGPRGVYRNVGLPGTGLSYREKIGSASGRSSRNQSAASSGQVDVEISEDGKMQFTLPDGSPASQSVAKRVREQNAELIEGLISRAVARFNSELRACLSAHLDTPAPLYRPLVVLSEPPEKPTKPVPRKPSFWDKLFFRTRKIAAENIARQKMYDDACRDWEKEKHKFDRACREIEELNSLVEIGDMDAQSRVLENRLEEVVWAKPTEISFDFGNDSTTISLDVDLPTIQELPDREALEPTRGVNIRWKKRTDAQLRRDFCYLAHATLFRLSGEVFAALPKVKQVTISGFTQRLDSSIGITSDVYVLSVRISRDTWEKIDFRNLQRVDVQAALESFELARDMTRNGELREITPFA